MQSDDTFSWTNTVADRDFLPLMYSSILQIKGASVPLKVYIYLSTLFSVGTQQTFSAYTDLFLNFQIEYMFNIPYYATFSILGKNLVLKEI